LLLLLLLLQIDSIQRQDRKQHAQSTWARSNADALGIELSDDSNDEGLVNLQHGAIRASAAAAASGGGKRGRKKGKGDPLGAAAGGLDADSQVGLWVGDVCRTQLLLEVCLHALLAPLALCHLHPKSSALFWLQATSSGSSVRILVWLLAAKPKLVAGSQNRAVFLCHFLLTTDCT
jgi:hypothetical protein